MTGRHHPFFITLAVYLLSVLAMATVGAVVPFIAAFADVMKAPPSAIALAIALFSAPTAIFAAVGGGIIDRVGLRPSLLASGVLLLGGDAIVYGAGSLYTLYAGMLFSGVGYGIVAIGAPAMLIASIDGKARVRSMSFWSTYAPTGFAVGLLFAVPFADGPYWRMTQVAHAALVLVAVLLALAVLPGAERAQDVERKPGGAGLFSVFRDVALLRLAIAVAIPNAISYGTSLVAPSYFAKAHNISLAASSSSVAFAKIVAMMVGGVVMGHLLARDLPGKALFLIVAAVGMVAQVLIYLPASPFLLALAALILWLFAFGGISGTAMALLPALVHDKSRSAAASGLINQAISTLSFLTPSLYFGLPGWGGYVALAVVGLGLCMVALPSVRTRNQTAVNPPSTTSELPET